jgi:hypothetical protein
MYPLHLVFYLSGNVTGKVPKYPSTNIQQILPILEHLLYKSYKIPQEFSWGIIRVFSGP